MKKSFPYSTTAVAIAIGLIAVSTVILSSFIYIRWLGRENLVDETLKQNISRRIDQYRERIEQSIIDDDGRLFSMIDVEDPDSWPAAVGEIRRGDFNVDLVFVFRLDGKYPLYPPWSREIANSWGQVVQKSYPELVERGGLVLNQTAHLHKERLDNYFFSSYALKANRSGERFLIFFQMSNDKLLAMVDRHLRELQSDYYVSIVDFDNIGVYLQPIPKGQYSVEVRFRSTLYKWLLQAVPRNYTEMEEGARNRRRAYLFLITLSVTMIFCSLVIIVVAGRRERQLAQLKEEFIGNVSHELKTPLSLIRMFSEILVTDRVKNDAARQEYYRIIHNESDRMGRLVANLLDFARLERERQSLHLEKTNIAQLVTKELEAYRYQVQKEGFTLTAHVDSRIPDTLADPNAVSMALFNLLDNAVKYSGERKQVTVRVYRTDGFVDLSVTDEGPGIPESERSRIFEKFYRGSSASNLKVRGSGIGLSITRQVAEMHGGEIRVDSEPGQGSTFTLRIPILDTSGAESA